MITPIDLERRVLGADKESPTATGGPSFSSTFASTQHGRLSESAKAMEKGTYNSNGAAPFCWTVRTRLHQDSVLRAHKLVSMQTT